MASRYTNEILVDGLRYRRHACGIGRYHSLCGTVLVPRHSYRQIGVHNGPTVIPLELEGGIVENATPALALSVLQGFATMPLRGYEEEMSAAHRTVPSRSTLQRIAKRAGTKLKDQLPLIEPQLRDDERLPSGVHSISVGIDRTTIPMAEALPPLPDYWYRKRARRLPPPITVAYRMAYVATIALNDKFGATLKTQRVSATAEEGAVEMMERLGAELEHIRRRRPGLPIVVIQDGAPELWRLVESWFGDLKIPVELKLIDRYHLAERLAQLAEVLERDDGARHRLLSRWHEELDRSDASMRRICDEVESRLYVPRDEDSNRRATRHDAFDDWPVPRKSRLGPHATQIAEGHLGYCTNNADKFRYRTAKKNGFPVGSGVTEGACKSVVGARFKRSGQRWFEEGASACLHTRTLHLNERLQRAFAAHLRLLPDVLCA